MSNSDVAKISSMRFIWAGVQSRRSDDWMTLTNQNELVDNENEIDDSKKYNKFTICYCLNWETIG